jgi:Tfp pilus assembly protein PilF
MALGSKWDKVELAPSILIGSMTRLFKHHWFVLHLILLACCLAGCGDRSDTGSDVTAPASNPIPEKFFQLMNRGKNYLDQGDTSNALNAYREAADLVSNDPDVHLNLANVHLLSGEGDAAVHEADLALELEPQSAAAYFVKGSAFLRLQRPEDAVKALTNSLSIDPGVTAAFFQLGLARMELEQWEEAITAFREGIRLDPNRLHSSAHYLLARSLIRVGKQEEAQKELEMHQANVGGEGPSMGDAVFERCKHTFRSVWINRMPRASRFSLWMPRMKFLVMLPHGFQVRWVWWMYIPLPGWDRDWLRLNRVKVFSCCPISREFSEQMNPIFYLQQMLKMRAKY